MEGSLDLFAMAAGLAAYGETSQGLAIAAARLSSEALERWRRERGPLPAEDGTALSAAAFRERYDAPARPALIAGLAASWGDWSLETLTAEWGAESFALHTGEQFPLNEYLAYARGRAELAASPLYLFEDLSLCKEGERKHALLARYAVPELFPRDLFALAGLEGAEGRPRFRWLLIGPARSGSRLHVDPVGTSAWNTLLSGHKRWVLFPPTLSPAQVAAIQGLGPDGPGAPQSAEAWFAAVLPALDRERLGAIELTQHPGETIFVPAGWWHTVVNLGLTVAVTQNFASEANLCGVAHEMRQQRPSRFKTEWFARMAAAFPDEPELTWPSALPHSWAESCELVRARASTAPGGAQHAAAAQYDEFVRAACECSPVAAAAAVPLALHVVWLGVDKQGLARAHRCLKAWGARHAKGWALRLWRSRDIESLGQRQQQQQVSPRSPTWSPSASGRMADNELRSALEVLHRQGGVAVTAGLECTASLDELLALMARAGASMAIGTSWPDAAPDTAIVISCAGHAGLELLRRGQRDVSALIDAGVLVLPPSIFVLPSDASATTESLPTAPLPGTLARRRTSDHAAH
jgi:histone arginine demethylase JMJD6